MLIIVVWHSPFDYRDNISSYIRISRSFALRDVSIERAFRLSRSHTAVRRTVRRRPPGRPVGYYKRYVALGASNETSEFGRVVNVLSRVSHHSGVFETASRACFDRSPYRRRPLGRSVGYYKRYVALDVTNERKRPNESRTDFRVATLTHGTFMKNKCC